MAWNDPGKNENPWKRKPEQGPPDLDEVLRRFQKKLRSLFGGGGPRPVGGGISGGSAAIGVGSIVLGLALLRWRRSEARSALEALPFAALPLFLADHQGLTGARTGLDGLQLALERLFGFPAPAAAWEREILPARVEPYLAAWLDVLCEEQGLRWLGAGPERVAFALEGDLALLAAESARAEPGAPAGGDEPLRRSALALLDGAPRGLDLAELAERLDAPTGAVARALWELAWRGEAANDTARALRQGALAGDRARLRLLRKSKCRVHLGLACTVACTGGVGCLISSCVRAFSWER